MKKQQAQMLILFCILVLCVGGYLVAGTLPEEEEITVTSKSYTVTNVNEDEIVEMTYLYEGQIIELVKENDIWKSKEDAALNLNQSVIENMVGYAAKITTDTVIEEPEALADYGLSNPANTICLTLSDNSIMQVLVGDYLDITNENYILLAGDSKVYTISSYIINSFNKSIEDLIMVEETENEIEESESSTTITE